MNNSPKKVLAMLMALVMCISLVPTTAFANNAHEDSSNEVQAEEGYSNEDEIGLDDDVIVQPNSDNADSDDGEEQTDNSLAKPTTNPEQENDEYVTPEESSTTDELLASKDGGWTSTYYGSCGEHAAFSISNGVMTISGTGDMYDFENASDRPGCWQRDSIHSIVIQEGITYIGKSAFAGLEFGSLTLPSTLLSIGEGAFSGCTEISRVEIPDGVQTIGNDAFANCTSLQILTFPNTLKVLGNNAFWQCEELITVTLPSSLKTIGRGTFACSGVRDVIVSEGISDIGKGAFNCCNNLVSVSLPTTLTTISDSAFYHCVKLEAIKIPSNVTNIGCQSFQDCAKIKSITLPSSTYNIGEGAFSGCSGLEKLIIPKTVHTIGWAAFSHCTSLTRLLFLGDPPSIGDAILFNDKLTVYYPCSNSAWTEDIMLDYGGAVNWKHGHNLTKHEEIPCSCTEEGVIEYWQCNDCGKLFEDENGDYEIELKDTVIRRHGHDFSKDSAKCAYCGIGQCGYGKLDNGYWVCSNDGVISFIINGATPDCSYSTQYRAWDSFKNIATSAFFSDGTTRIGDRTLYGFSLLSDAYIPETVAEIGDSAFEGCSSIDSIIIPDSVVTLEYGVLQDCINLKTVTLPNHLETIPNRMFSGCTSLVNIQIPVSVKAIYGFAFFGCTSLSEIELPSTITSIAGYAFKNCKSLDNIFLPDIGSISMGLFAGCSSLKNITFNGNISEINASAFADCSSLKQFEIPNGVTTLYRQAFMGCTNLEKISIPESVTSINDDVFYGCTYLSEIEIPAGVTSIGDFVFGNCEALRSVAFKGNAPNLCSYTFYEDSCDVFYPCNNSTWTVAINNNYGGILVWKESHNFVNKKCTGCGEIDNILTSANFPDAVFLSKLQALYPNGLSESEAAAVTRLDVSNSEVTSLKGIELFTGITHLWCYNNEKLCSIDLSYNTKLTHLLCYNNSLTSLNISNNTELELLTCYENNLSFLDVSSNTLLEVLYCDRNSLIWLDVSNNTKLTDLRCNSNNITSLDVSYNTELEKLECQNNNLLRLDVSNNLKLIHLECDKNNLSSLNLSNNANLSTCVVSPQRISVELLTGNKIDMQSVVWPGSIDKVSNVTGGNYDSYTGWMTVNSDVEEITYNYTTGSLSNEIMTVFIEVIRKNPFGTCGDNLIWYLDENGLLTISGTGCMYDYYDDTPWKAYKYRIKSASISNGVTSIGSCAFYECVAMTSIEIPNSVTNIGCLAFYGCFSLASVEIPDSVINIEEGAFSNCGLVSIEIPNSVISIGHSAFFGCGEITSVEISDSVNEISTGVFGCCPKLKTITVAESNEYYSSNEGVLFDKQETTLISYPEGKSSTYVIPEGVTNIAAEAFIGCTSLTSIEIPESVTRIGDYAFENCGSLTQIDIPRSVTNIRGYAFSNCKKLNRIKFWHNSSDELLIDSCAFGILEKNTVVNTTVEVLDENEINPAISRYNWLDSNRTVKYIEIEIPVKKWDITYILGDKRVDNSENPICYEEVHKEITLIYPTLNGYSFDGWYLDETFAIEAAAPQIKADDTGAKTFYAKWSLNSYSIKFMPNGGTGKMTALANRSDADGELTVTNNFKRTGYKFSGWNTKADGTGANTLTIYELAPYADAKNVITLYAQWEPIEYTVVFDANGGNGVIEPVTLKYGESWTVVENTFKRTGYIPNAWKCGSKAYKNGQPVKNLSTQDGATVTLTAQWKAYTAYDGYNYSVVFNGNGNTGGKTSPEAMKVGTSKALTANGFTKTGYHFEGWALTEDGAAVYSNKEKVLDLNIPGGAKEVKLFAVWAPNTYTVSFNGNGGKLDKATAYTQSLTYDADADLDGNQFTRTGYTFKEWNTKKDGKGVSYADNEIVQNLTSTANGNVTLYAIWEANTYTIVYQTYHGTGAVESQTVSYDKSVKLNANAFSFPGYSFKNWTGSDGKTYSNQASVKNLCTGEDNEHNTIVLTANWTENTYTVKFNANGAKGTLPKQITCYGDEPVVIPECSLTFSGYRFKEWNTKADATGDAFKPGQENVVFDTKNKATVTLYAIWNYTVTFNPGTGTGTPAVKEDMVYNCIADVQLDFTNSGYYLAGWNKDAAKAAKGTVQYKVEAVKNVGPDATLFAVWKPFAYTIKFDANGGKGTMKSLSMTYGTAKTLTANAFTKSGMVFKGWNTQPDGKGITIANRAKVTTELVPERNKQIITLYAIWS